MVIDVNSCSKGVLVRWYMNGWHHYMFRYELERTSKATGTQVKEVFSNISRIEQPTFKEVKTFYNLGAEGVNGKLYDGIKGILWAEYVEAYLYGNWYALKVERSSYVLSDGTAYTFVIRAELVGAGMVERNLLANTEIDIHAYYSQLIKQETFDEDEPWGFTVSKNPYISELVRATIGDYVVAKILLDADPSDGIEESHLIMVMELANYSTNYGKIKTTIDFSTTNDDGEINYEYVNGFRQMTFTQRIGYDTAEESMAIQRKTYIKKNTISQDTPLRYLRLIFQNTSKTTQGTSVPVNCYIDRIRIEHE